MNEYELQRVIRFIKRTRAPYGALVPSAEPNASWNIVTHLIESEITGHPVTLSTLVDISELPYATALRRVHWMIDEGAILKRSKTQTGKSFTLHPSPELKARFEDYARQMKCLLAETFGRKTPVEDENDFYSGGLAERSTAEGSSPASGKDAHLRFLLHDDNYFASMRNMWVDFRSNRASRRDFEMRVLPDLHARLLANAEAAVSDFDVVTVNISWLAEFASQGALYPVDAFMRPDAIQPDDFHPLVWQTGAWKGAQYAVPIYVAIEILAMRRDLFEEARLQPPEPSTTWSMPPVRSMHRAGTATASSGTRRAACLWPTASCSVSAAAAAAFSARPRARASRLITSGASRSTVRLAFKCWTICTAWWRCRRRTSSTWNGSAGSTYFCMAAALSPMSGRCGPRVSSTTSIPASSAR